jgi:uncharacterized protein YkwD
VNFERLLAGARPLKADALLARAAPAAIVDAWMHSPPHRANLLRKDLRLAGFGVAAGTPNTGANGITVTLDLGSR